MKDRSFTSVAAKATGPTPAQRQPVTGSLCFSASDELFGSEDSENPHREELDAAWHNVAALERIRATLRRDLADFGYLNNDETHHMRIALKLAGSRITQLAH